MHFVAFAVSWDSVSRGLSAARDNCETSIVHGSALGRKGPKRPHVIRPYKWGLLLGTRSFDCYQLRGTV